MRKLSHKINNAASIKKALSWNIFKKAMIGLLVLFICSFFINIKILLFVTIAVIFNAKLVDFQFKRGLPTDLELSTFSTVLITQGFGLHVGLFTAVSTKLIASFYSGGVIADHLLMILSYCFAAIIASFFPAANAFTLGMIIVVINCIFMFIASIKILNVGITENIAFTGTNFCFNLVVFSIFSGLVSSWL